MFNLIKAAKMMFQAATINAVTTSTQIELALMYATNQERISNDHSLAYSEKEFHDLYVQHNDTIKRIVGEKK